MSRLRERVAERVCLPVLDGTGHGATPRATPRAVLALGESEGSNVREAYGMCSWARPRIVHNAQRSQGLASASRSPA